MAFLIEGWAELAQRSTEVGVALRTDEPLEGYDRVYVDDPFGNRVELLELLRTGAGSSGRGPDGDAGRPVVDFFSSPGAVGFDDGRQPGSQPRCVEVAGARG